MTQDLQLDDIVFEERNKTYGAYELRRTYDKHASTAIAIAVSLFLLFISLPTIISLLNGTVEIEKVIPKPTGQTDLKPPPIIEKPLIIPPTAAVPPPPPKIIKFLPPTLTEEEVKKEDEMQTIEDVKQNMTGPVDITGSMVEPTFDAPTATVIEAAPPDQIYLSAEQMPEFPGGVEELMKFLGKKTKYPSLALKMNTQGTVFVGFIVSKEGRINEVTIVKGLSKECDDEAMRVIQSMPDWKPGKQNGRTVSVKYVLPIKFRLEQ
jgi:periplasmic protein TonB